MKNWAPDFHQLAWNSLHKLLFCDLERLHLPLKKKKNRPQVGYIGIVCVTKKKKKNKKKNIPYNMRVQEGKGGRGLGQFFFFFGNSLHVWRTMQLPTRDATCSPPRTNTVCLRKKLQKVLFFSPSCPRETPGMTRLLVHVLQDVPGKKPHTLNFWSMTLPYTTLKDPRNLGIPRSIQERAHFPPILKKFIYYLNKISEFCPQNLSAKSWQNLEPWSSNILLR